MTESYLQVLKRRNRFTLLLAVLGALFINSILFIIMPMLLGKHDAVPRVSEVVPDITLVHMPVPREKEPEKQKMFKHMPKTINASAVNVKEPPRAKPMLKPLPFHFDSDFMPSMQGLENLPADMNFATGLKPEGVFSVGDLNAPLTLKVRIPPVYPLRARERRIEGWVKVRLLVDRDGEVKEAEIVEARPPGYFEKSVLHSVKRWKFAPPRVSGEAVRVWMVTKIRFKLED